MATKTLSQYQAEKRHIKNEVGAIVLCVRDSVTNELVVMNADASGNLVVSSVGGTGTQDVTASYLFNYSAITVNTADYTEIIASTASAITRIDVFDSSGEIIGVYVGASGSEILKFIIAPGGVILNLIIPAGSRISLKSLSVAPTAGNLIINAMT